MIRGFLIAFIIFTIAPFIAEYYEHEVLDIIIQVIALTLIVNSFGNINTVKLQRDLNFKKLSYIEQINSFFSFIVVIGLAYYFRDVWALVIVHVASCLLGVILSYIFVPGKPCFHLDFKIARKLFSYGKFITGLTIVIYVTMEVDNLIIGKILGLNVLGYYVLAYTLANLPATHFAKIVSRVLFPAYSQLQGNMPALQSTFLHVYKIVAIINIPITVLFIVLAPEIIRAIYGDKWLPATDALRILAIFGFFRSLSGLGGYMFNAVGKPNLTFYLNLVRLILLLILIFPLTEKYGLVGASLAVTIPILLQYILENYLIGKVIKINYIQMVKILMLPLIYGIAMFAVIIFSRSLLYIINTKSAEFNITETLLMSFNHGIGFYMPNTLEVAFVIVLSMSTYLLLSYKQIIYQIRKIKSLVKS